MSIPPSHNQPITEDNDNESDKDSDSDSVISDSGDFEKEMTSQADLDTPTCTVDLGEAGAPLQPVSSPAYKPSTHTSTSRSSVASLKDPGNKSNNVTVNSSGEHMTSTTSSQPTGKRFHRRILLLLPLLYLACTPALPWSLQITAQLLLAFVLLTLAVSLTSTPPKVSELGREMLMQSQLILARSHEEGTMEEEHAPASQGILGSSLLVLIVVSLAYLQASGSLQQIVLEITTPPPVTVENVFVPITSSPLLDLPGAVTSLPAEQSDSAGLDSVLTFPERGSDLVEEEVSIDNDGMTSFFSFSQANIRRGLLKDTDTGIDRPPVAAAVASDDVPLVPTKKVMQQPPPSAVEKEVIDTEDYMSDEEREQQEQKLQENAVRGGGPSLLVDKEITGLSEHAGEGRESVTSHNIHVVSASASASAVSDGRAGTSSPPTTPAASSTLSAAEVNIKDGISSPGGLASSGTRSRSNGAVGSVSDSGNKDSHPSSTGVDNDYDNHSPSRSKGKSDSEGSEQHASRGHSRMSVYVDMAPHHFTPYGTGVLRPGDNLTFCGDLSARPSLWRRMTAPLKRIRRDKKPLSTSTSTSSARSDTSTDSSSTDPGSSHTCEAQILTVSDAGLVVIQQVHRRSDDNNSPPPPPTPPTPPPAPTGTKKNPTPAHSSSSSSAEEGKGSSAPLVWKGNYFPLWQRAIRKLRKPLPHPVLLAYSFAENNLTLWKVKKKIIKDKKNKKKEGIAMAAANEGSSPSNSNADANVLHEKEEDMAIDLFFGTTTADRSSSSSSLYSYKQWKVFKVASGNL